MDTKQQSFPIGRTFNGNKSEHCTIKFDQSQIIVYVLFAFVSGKKLREHGSVSVLCITKIFGFVRRSHGVMPSFDWDATLRNEVHLHIKLETTFEPRTKDVLQRKKLAI